MNAPTPSFEPSESGNTRRCRIAGEAEGIEKARASVAAGRLIEADAIDAWIDSLGTDRELPPPGRPAATASEP